MYRVRLFILLTFLSIHAKGQLCSGSLGDPVAVIDFGSGFNTIGQALPAGKTNYTYLNTSCPSDGQYSIVSSTPGCFTRTWHNISSDHTPNDIGGYFMLVNASLGPGVFYIDTIKTLCGNTTYEFSSYIINMVNNTACGGNPIAPNLTFRIETIDGTILTTYNTGNLSLQSTPNWTQYGTFITTSSNPGNIIIKIINNAPGGCGNDLAIDDIMFRPCGPQIDIAINGKSGKDTTVCLSANNSIELQEIHSNGFINPQKQWQKSIDSGRTWIDIVGEVNTYYTIKPSSLGTTYYRVLIGEGININVSSCRIASNPIKIAAAPDPILNVPKAISVCAKSDVTIVASGANTYQWVGPNGFTSFLQNPVIANIQKNDSGVYKVKGVSVDGCIAMDSTTLHVLPGIMPAINPFLSGCEGEFFQLNASGGLHYKWMPANVLNNDTIPNPTAKPKDTTLFTVVISNELGCNATATTLVNIWKLPFADAGPDQQIFQGDSVKLLGTISGSNVKFNWQPITNNNQLQPFVKPNFSQSYQLTAISDVGCGESIDIVWINVIQQLKVPNTFTPNGDGYNDYWEFKNIPLPNNYKVEVFTSTGQLVYSTIGYNTFWDGRYNGKKLPAGTYYYVIDTKTTKYQKIAGFVTLIY
jgi:gliding motility-associated-like protein